MPLFGSRARSPEKSLDEIGGEKLRAALAAIPEASKLVRQEGPGKTGSTCFAGNYRGHTLRLKLETSHSRGTWETTLSAEVPVATSFQLTLTQKNLLTRQLGLRRTNKDDPAFDARFAVKVSEDPSGLHADYLLDEEVKRRLMETFQDEILSLERVFLLGVGKAGIHFEWFVLVSSPEDLDFIRPEFIRGICDALAALGDRARKLGP